ncbi:MAG: hypothetical protein V7K71_04190 [Nostoc sp.]
MQQNSTSRAIAIVILEKEEASSLRVAIVAKCWIVSSLDISRINT